MKKKIIIVLCIIVIIEGFGACSRSDSKESVYQWPCPIDGISWGDSKEDLMDHFKWKENDYKENVITDNSIMLLPDEKIKVYGYKATVYFRIELGYGLLGIVVKYEDKYVDKITDVLADKYGKGETMYSWYGSRPEDLEPEIKEKYINYLLRQGYLSQDTIEDNCSLPFVIINWYPDPSERYYGECMINAGRAAGIEHALKE